MVKLKRKQILLEPWQEEMIDNIAAVRDISFCEALRYIICFTCLDLRGIIKLLRGRYSDASFEGRKAYEKRYK